MVKKGSTFTRTPQRDHSRRGRLLSEAVKHQLVLDFEEAHQKDDIDAIIEGRPGLFGNRNNDNEKPLVKACKDRLTKVITKLHQSDRAEYW